MIKVENIKKTFEGNEVLKGVSFDLSDKGLVAIFGKSGSGKTTLLNIIGGLEYQSSGNVYIDDLNLSKHRDKIRNENIGFIFQNYYLESGYTIEEIMHNAMHIAGFSDQREIERRTTEVLKIVDLERYKHKESSALSGGQKQRVAIARALIKGAKIILADEPTGNLDAKNTYKVMNILKAISKERLVVLVTHEVSLIKEYSDSHIKIVDGLVDDTANIDEETAYADLTYDESYKEDIDTSALLSFTKSNSKRNGILYTFKNIFSIKKKDKDKETISNTFKHIFIVIMAALVCALSFIIYKSKLDEYEIKEYDSSSVYTSMSSYSEIRRLDRSLYDSIDFYKLGYNVGSFSYNNLKSLSSIDVSYTPKTINDNLEVEYGNIPGSKEVLITRSLAETLKENIRIKELENDSSLLLMLFEQDYKVSGIVSGSSPYIYFNRVDYINFIGVYSEVYLTDNSNIFFESDFIDSSNYRTVNSYSAEVALYEDNNPTLNSSECTIEINRNAIYRMMSDTTKADSKITKADNILIDSPQYMYITDSYPLYIKKLSLTRSSMTTDIKIFVTEETLNNIFAYIEPNIDNLDSDNSYYFEIKTSSEDQLLSLKNRLNERGVVSIDIKAEYEDLINDNKTALSSMLIYILAGVMVILIYFFIEKSGSVKNTKEYGVYRAIGVNRSNLLFKELLNTITSNLVTFSIAYIIGIVVLSIRYAIGNIAVMPFIGISALCYIVSIIVMMILSLIPYLFVVFKSPSRILASYDI